MSSSVNSSVSPAQPDMGKAEDMEEDLKDREAGVEAATQIINTDICTRLQGLQPTKQQDIDTLIR